MLLPHGTVIAIVDGRNFELYRNAGNAPEPELAALPSPELDSSNHSGGSKVNSIHKPSPSTMAPITMVRNAAGPSPTLNA